MSIGVEQLESWIGSEVHGADGEKLGKIDEVYFAATEPVAVGIRSGLAGRKHHVATLNGAQVSYDGIRLGVGEADLVSTDGEALTAGQISALSGHDDRLRDLQPDQVEGWQQREERRKAAEDARGTAQKLEREAQLRSDEEHQAASDAGDADNVARAARREREDAEARAAEARAAADRIQDG